jgi:alpha-L-rhamnosidase
MTAPIFFGLLCALTSPAGDETRSGAPGPGLAARDLRCEGRRDPLGIESPRPRLSWVLEAVDPSARGQRQTAHRILVASSPDRLAAEEGDLWDSGKVESAESHLVPYGGKTLASWTGCAWKVQVWDREGRPSEWSAPARWTMGLLAPGDWKGRWIAAGGEGARHPLEGCSWIWFPEPGGTASPPPGVRFFRKRFEIPAGASIEAADFDLAADNSFVLSATGREAGRGDAWETASRIDLAKLLAPGPNVLALAVTNGGTSPNPAGAVGRLAIRLGGGREVIVPIDGTWKSSAREAPGWRGLDFDDSAWPAARVLGPLGMEPWKKIGSPQEPLPLFRKEFDLAGPVRRALVAVCGLGQFELRVNGRKVGEATLEPGWTNYRARCLYTVRDVTALLAPGRNAIGVLLGNGMYNVTGGRYVKFTGSFGPPKLILGLRIEGTDGSVTEMGTDVSWKTAPGPIRFSCIYGGEDHDARLEAPGWDRPGFDDRSWRPAAVVEGPGGRLAAASAPEVSVVEEVPTVRIAEPRPGVLIHDLGRNFSGRPRITVEGPAGATVKLIPGELLTPSGLVSQRSSGGPVSFSYMLRGGGPETWSPRFTYYGFRYVQVEGAAPARGEAGGAGSPARPKVQDLRGEFTHAAAERVGEFRSSDPDLGRIHDLIVAAIRSNLQSVLTDCPHREKLGWLEVAHLLGGGIAYNFDLARFFEKVAGDMREAQTKEGLVPDIAPEYTVFSGGFRDSPEWGSAYVVVPWLAYLIYGDRSLLEEHYEGMGRYVAYLESKAKDGIVSHGLGDWYDIGPRGPGESQLTSRGLTATAICFGDLVILRDAARLLGREDDARSFAGRAERMRESFNRKFLRPDGSGYDRGSQTAQAMPLVLGLVPEDRRAAVLDGLVRGIRATGSRVTAGDVGFLYLERALSDGGRGDVLLDMVLQKEGPGYLLQLAKGATTLTEAWDANPASSHNHCMLGHAEEWFFRGLGGIRPDPEGPGFRRFAVRPDVPPGLASVAVRYDSVRGRIESGWRREGDRLVLEVRAPVGSTATVFVPARDAESVTEGGRPAAGAEGVRFLRMEGGAAVFDVASGRYRFVSRT